MIDIIIPTCKTQPEIADLAAEILRTADCSARVILTGEDVSAAANRNLGLNQATSEYVIMVDDDVCEFPLGWVHQLIDVFLLNRFCIMASARLLNEDGTPGPMLRNGPPGPIGGWMHVDALPTACVAFRNNGLRFDENFVGSGFEDDDFCAQLRQKHPNGGFIINEDVRVVHRNEMKNQGFIKGQGPVPGGNFEKNQAYYESKWGKRP